MCKTATVELSNGDSISTGIVDAIAAVERADPIDLEFRLGNYLDPDALNQLYDDHPERETTPTFTVSFDEYEVRIDSSRTVTATRACEDVETCSPVEVIDE